LSQVAGGAPAGEDARDSARLEAFSDGVFAIAITLLILELKVPPHDVPLASALWERWPSYVAFLTSFVTSGIMWLNHHRLFAYIGRVDHWLIVINGMLLLGVTFLPFPTAVIAEHFGHPGERVAALFYSGTMVFIAIAFALLRWYPRHRPNAHLLDVPRDHPAMLRIKRQYRLGLPLYVLFFVVTWYAPRVGMALLILFAFYFALPVSRRSAMS
jgi:uncharacterized membrane protein